LHAVALPGRGQRRELDAGGLRLRARRPPPAACHVLDPPPVALPALRLQGVSRARPARGAGPLFVDSLASRRAQGLQPVLLDRSGSLRRALGRAPQAPFAARGREARDDGAWMAVYGVLGDIHGNREALAAVLDALEERGVERVLCVGDIVGYNADPD